jgi:hypothetical protein
LSHEIEKKIAAGNIKAEEMTPSNSGLTLVVIEESLFFPTIKG